MIKNKYVRGMDYDRFVIRDINVGLSSLPNQNHYILFTRSFIFFKSLPSISLKTPKQSLTNFSVSTTPDSLSLC